MTLMRGSILRSGVLRGGILRVPSFSPLAPDLEFWGKANDPSTVNDVASYVYQFDDKSGNANNLTQGNGGNQARTGITNLNGENLIEFDGSDFFSLTSEIDVSTGITMFVVFLKDVASRDQTIVGHTGDGGLQVRIDATEKVDIVRQGQAVVLSGTVSTSLTGDLLTVQTSSAGNSTRLNGIDADSNATNPLYTAGISMVGAAVQPTTIQEFEGGLGELLIYRGILSAERILEIEEYLTDGWGL